MAETEVHGTRKIQGQEISTFSIESTAEDSSFESFEHTERSVMETDQSVQQVEHSRGAQEIISFPKVLFTEWLSFDHECENDHDLGNYSGSFKNNLENHCLDIEDNLIDDLLQNEGTFGVETNLKSYGVYVDDMLGSPFKLEY